ncbi:MAG: DEAD/DEAH box helicase family protein, partial [Bacteroidota bacterium]
LCPSITIEKELQRKFLQLAGSEHLRNTIPEGAKLKNPRIIDANQTIGAGDICIENIHAVYSNTNSSIKDSLGYNKGRKCLILSDEVHHAYNKVSGNTGEARSIKKWKEFLMSPSYAFRYMLGFTGTAYINNEYFNDVIYRYSLKQATEDAFVKKINYVSRDDSGSENEKFQKIYQNHQENKLRYNLVRPLTILVTNNIRNAKQLETRIVEFLAQKEQLPEEAIRNTKVITVTSDKTHEHNVAKLDDVDHQSQSVEWIVSVSMLTEGWDVKNVFQIVPMEERAFNSKLLISQVLGRGLRIPKEYEHPVPSVTVFNHDSWSSKIKGLVDEILEIELRLASSVLLDQERSKYHFDLYNIDYTKEFKTIENEPSRKEFDYT